jgi:hypothetical protein
VHFKTNTFFVLRCFAASFGESGVAGGMFLGVPSWCSQIDATTFQPEKWAGGFFIFGEPQKTRAAGTTFQF